MRYRGSGVSSSPLPVPGAAPHSAAAAPRAPAGWKPKSRGDGGLAPREPPPASAVLDIEFEEDDVAVLDDVLSPFLPQLARGLDRLLGA